MLRNSPLAMPLIGSNLPHSVVEEGIIHRVFPPDTKTPCRRLSLFDGLLCQTARKIKNRRMRNRTYGGVRGRKTKVGRKLLRFPPTRFYVIYFSSATTVSAALISCPNFTLMSASNGRKMSKREPNLMIPHCTPLSSSEPS